MEGVRLSAETTEPLLNFFVGGAVKSRKHAAKAIGCLYFLGTYPHTYAHLEPGLIECRRGVRMPNGKGICECCYCRHFVGDRGLRGYVGGHDSGLCTLWQVQIPSTADTGEHRVCTRFNPDALFARDNGFGAGPPPDPLWPQCPEECVRISFAQFGKAIRPGVLYVFFYAEPHKVRERLQLGLAGRSEPEGKDGG
jgi:hypothetical protein